MTSTAAFRISFLILRLCLGLCVGVTAPQVFADTLKIPLGQQGQSSKISTPTLGTSKARVMAQFGQPLHQSGPVGNPAIYTWQYEQFEVYFEGDHVIHSVVKFTPTQ